MGTSKVECILKSRLHTGITSLPPVLAMVAGLLILNCGRERDGGAASRGQPPGGPEVHPRLVSMAPSLTEILFALGLGQNVVGVTRYCDYPPEALERQKVGGLYDPNMEAIIALEPDAVVLLKEQGSLREGLDRLGIRWVQTSNKTLEDILAAMDSLGRHFGAAKTADSLAGEFRRRLAGIEAAGRTSPFAGTGASRPRVLISVGRNLHSSALTGAYVAGTKTFYADLLRRAGGENAYRGRLEYPQIAAEGIVRLDPDFIFDMVPDLEAKGLTVPEVKAQWAAWEELRAVREDRVVVFPQDFSVIPGPRLILLLEEMARVLQGSPLAPHAGEENGTDG